MIYEGLCTMPNGRSVFFPIFISLLAFVMTFRTLSSCDLVETKWLIDCSSEESPNCVYEAKLGLGLLAKEILVKKGDDQAELYEDIERECRWYTDEEREWLLDMSWTSSLMVLTGCLSLGFFGVFVLLLSSFCSLKKFELKAVSNSFTLAALLNIAPLVVFLKSGICATGGVCDEDVFFCVSECEFGTSAFEIIASCFMWTGSAISTLMLMSHRHKIRRGGKEELKKRVSDLNLKECKTDETADCSLPEIHRDDENPYIDNQLSSPSKNASNPYIDIDISTPRNNILKERVNSPGYQGNKELFPLPTLSTPSSSSMP